MVAVAAKPPKLLAAFPSQELQERQEPAADQLRLPQGLTFRGRFAVGARPRLRRAPAQELLLESSSWPRRSGHLLSSSDLALSLSPQAGFGWGPSPLYEGEHSPGGDAAHCRHTT